MSANIRFDTGDPSVQSAILRCWNDSPAHEVLHDNARRALVRIAVPELGAILVKRFRVRRGRHALRERLKRSFERDGATREWQLLLHLSQRGVPVPEPLAVGTTPEGDRLLAMRFVPGRPFAAVLSGRAAARRNHLRQLGETVLAMHDAGVAHADLHVGNVLATEAGVVLCDFQRAFRTDEPGDRERDLGWLDYSLGQHVSLPDRLRVRSAALGVARPFDGAARDRVRRVGAASTARAAEHARSRTRHSLRVGRRFAAVALAEGEGLRDRRLATEATARILSAHVASLAAGDERVLKHDGRSGITRQRDGEWRVVVKAVAARTLGRALADVVRGSPGRRAWRGGHGLIARRIGAAAPLAFLERRRLGVPVESWIVLTDLEPAEPADTLAGRGSDPEALMDALTDLAIALHRRQVDHGDLKSSHVYLDGKALRAGSQLLDLEGVRFPRRLSEARRITALAQLNASLPDNVPAAVRRRAFARYARALPFSDRGDALLRIVRESRTRAHRWTGSDCALS